MLGHESTGAPDRLGRSWDGLVRGTRSEMPPDSSTAVIRRVHDVASGITPDPAFVARLERELARQIGAPRLTAPSTHGVPVAWRDQPMIAPTVQCPPRADRATSWMTVIAVAAVAILALMAGVTSFRRDAERPSSDTRPDAAILAGTAEWERVALLIVVDRSGSMSYDPLGGASKLDLARAVARNAVAALAPGDQAGVLLFNERTDLLVPMRPLTADADWASIRDALDDIRGEGGSEAHLALRAAADTILEVDADHRHVILLTDGKSRRADREPYHAALDRLAAGGVTLSTVGLGDDADGALLQFLAAEGGGRFHRVEHLEDVPTVSFRDGRLDFVAATPVAGTPVPVGVRPTRVLIPTLGVDASVEALAGTGSVMPMPPRPFVVGWDTGSVGLAAGGNTLLGGHNYYWNVGPAVFVDLHELAPGDRIEITGDNGLDYAYSVASVRSYDIAALTPERAEEIVGPTAVEIITLFTSGGEFDTGAGQYRNRVVVRASRIDVPPAPAPVATSATTPVT